MAILRETAHRVFAQEFTSSHHNIAGEGEKDASYVVSPLGAKMNRVHVVGVCTDVEPVGEAGDQWRARISDPTGVFTVYAGQYQPEASHAMSKLEPPQFVAVTGKARTYEPEPGSVFVSIRPETVNVVDEATRDAWITRTAERTLDRLDANEKLKANPEATEQILAAEGVLPADAEGAILAQQAYGFQDGSRFKNAAVEALRTMVAGEVPVHRIEPRQEDGSESSDSTTTTTAAPTPAAPAAVHTPEPAAAGDDALDDKVLGLVKSMEGDSGADWEDVTKEAAVDGKTAEEVEESLNRLMDKGLVYEPTLGVLKTT